MMKQKRKMPLGIRDFEEMRRGDYLYVDKTDIVWQLANGVKYNFLVVLVVLVSPCCALPSSVILKEGKNSLKD